MRPTKLALALLAALVLGPVGARADEPKTLKERLSDKASDEQRVDNCRVPIDRRGDKPRPDCPAASGTTIPPTTPDGTAAAQPH